MVPAGVCMEGYSSVDLGFIYEAERINTPGHKEVNEAERINTPGHREVNELEVNELLIKRIIN